MFDDFEWIWQEMLLEAVLLFMIVMGVGMFIWALAVCYVCLMGDVLLRKKEIWENKRRLKEEEECTEKQK